MRKIKIENFPDEEGIEYYLLEPRKLHTDEIPELVAKFLKKNEEVQIIDELGVKGSANQFVVVKRNHNKMTSEILYFDNDEQFVK